MPRRSQASSSRFMKRARPTSNSTRDRKSTRLNSSHSQISYAVFCLKKKLKEFIVLQPCSICGKGFDSQYKLLKHVSKFHPQPEKAGWAAGREDSCSCGHHTDHHDS